MKRFCFVLSLLLSTVCLADGAGVAPLNPAFLKWKARKERRAAQKKAAQTNQLAHAQLKTSSSILVSADDDEVDYGFVPEVADLSYLANINSGVQRAISQEGFSSTYDLRALGRLTDVRNQGIYGTCWAHATMASLESWLLTSENASYDFSENNLANLHGFDWGFDDGGNASLSSAYLLRWSGPVLESQDPYPNPGGSKTLAPARHVQRIRWIAGKSGSLDNDSIKDAIVKYGAIYASYYHATAYYNATYKSYYHPSATSGNHAVAIVGWDDNFSKAKFGTTPAGNGAYIVRNSWGNSWGDGGYFYVSYYDSQFARSTMYAFCSAEDVSKYTTIYQYDKYGLVASVGYQTATAHGAGIFIATTSDPIGAVGFYALAPKTAYAIQVRTGVTAGSPGSGTLSATQSGTVDDAGFVTIPLDAEVDVTSGTRFSVVVKLTTPGYGYPLAFEYLYPGYSSSATASPGQTFLSSNGSGWTDFTGVDSSASFCLKAYAKTGTTTRTLTAINCYSSDNSTKVASGKTKPFTCKATYSDGSEKEVTPTWSITSGSAYGSISASGLFTAASVAEEQDVGVMASYAEGGITKTSSFTVTITVSAPDVPTGLTATAGTESSCVRLAWTAANGASTYTVYRADGSNALSSSAKFRGTVDQTKYADTDATPGVDYTYFVKAKNGSGTSGFSTGVNGWRALAAPSDVAASDGTSTDCVKVGWGEVAGASVYRVYRGTDEDSLSPLSAWISDLAYSDETAEAGTLYYYAVQAALDTDGTRASALSLTDSGVREKANVPTALEIAGPSSLASGAIGSYSATVRWTNGSTTSCTPTWTCEGRSSTTATFSYAAPVVSASKTVTLTAQATVEGVALKATLSITVSPSVPATPSAPSVTAQSGSGISLSWTAVAGASHYVVYRGTSAAAASASEAGTATGTTFTDDKVQPGLTVYYFLAAANTAGTSARSAASSAAVRTLAAPTGVTASNGTYADKVRVTWNAVAGATHYRVSRATSSTGGQTDLGDGWTAETTFDDETAAAGTAYWYFVRAATSSSGANAGAKSTGARGLRKVAVSLSSLAISGADRVNAGATTVYAAKATYSDGTSKAVSPAWSIASGSGATIDAAGKLTAASVTSDASVTIQARLTENGATKTAAKSVAIIAPRVASVSVSNVKATSRWPWKPIIDVDYTITASPADTKAKVTVEARDEDRQQDLKPMALSGEGATGSVGAGSHRLSWHVAEDYPNFNASKVSVDVKASVASVGAPTNPSASPGTYTDKVVVSWTAVDDATDYEVWRGESSSTNAATLLATVEEATYADMSATAGKTYYYWIKAKDDSSTSEFSSVISGHCNVSAPTGVSATVATSTENVTVSWSAVTGASQYEVYRGTSSAFGSATKVKTTTLTSYADTTAAPGTTYYYWVKALCAQGTGSVSASVAGRRRVSAPTNVAASDGTSTTSVTVSWTAATGASSYQIWCGTSSSSAQASQIGTATATSYTHSNPTPGTTYYYWVKAVDAAGSASAFSASDTGYAKQERVLSGLEIEGPEALPSGCQGAYKMYATYSDGSRVDVTYSASWSIPTNQYMTLSSRTSDSAHGYYFYATAKTVESLQQVVVTASYTASSKTVTGTLTVSITPSGSLAYTYRLWPDGTGWLTGYTGDKSSVTALSLPSAINGVTITGCTGSWLKDFSSLTSVTVPSTFGEIGDYMFYDCSKLTEVTIPNSVTNICRYAFRDCYLMSSVTLPSFVKSIEVNAFESCRGLTSIKLPSSLITIGDGAFENCSSLKYMTIPNSVKVIGSAAFQNCSAMLQIVIPDSVTSIGREAFIGCSALTSVEIPDSVEYLPDSIFSGCHALQTVSLPVSLASIGQGAFVMCTNLLSISVDEGNVHFKDEDGVLFSKDGKKLIKYPDGKVGEYTVPVGTEEICSSCFCRAAGLTSLSIPETVKEIGYIVYASTLISWTHQGISDCSSLRSISVSENNPSFRSVDGVLYDKNVRTLVSYPGGKLSTSFVMPDSVRVNADYYGSANLTNVVMSDSSWCMSLFEKATCVELKLPRSTRLAEHLWANVQYVNVPSTVQGAAPFMLLGRKRTYFFGEKPWAMFSGCPERFHFSECSTWGAEGTHWDNPIYALEIDGENKVFAGQTVPLYAKGYFTSGHFGIASKADWMVVSGSAYGSINPSNGTFTAKSDVTTTRNISVYAETTLGGAYASAGQYNVQIVPANTNQTVLAFGQYAYIRLRWLPVANAVKYNIRRGTSSTYASASVIDTYLKETLDGTETYVDSSAALGTTYYYWVEALNANGTSINVSDVCSAARATGDLTYVRDVLTKLNNGTYTDASFVSEAEQGVLKEINYWKGVNATWVDYIRTGSLSSISGANEMFWRSMYDLNTYIGVVMTKGPDVTSATAASTTSVTVTWNTKIGATSYYLYRGTSDNSASASKIATVAGTSYTDTSSHASGTTYYYWVKAVTPVGTTDFGAAGVFVCKPTYLIVNLSAGTNASSYPTRTLWTVPSGGWDVGYKTTNLVLRLVQPGTFTMGYRSTDYPGASDTALHAVTLTKPFYMGVFEVTQKQYTLVMGSNPSAYTGDARPVESVSYNTLRGTSEGAQWPSGDAVDATRFMGKIRARTGLALDLPTEAQWEYACRAGTTTALNSGCNLTNAYSDASMDAVGCYYYNYTADKGGYTVGHKNVGSYAPNAWGLYDMHGNVWEWCLDWYSSSLGTSAVTDPVGAESASNRVLRGGGWRNDAYNCRSASRGSYPPSYGDNSFGFRLCLPAGL